jgi:hypothetical protein
VAIAAFTSASSSLGVNKVMSPPMRAICLTSDHARRRARRQEHGFDIRCHCAVHLAHLDFVVEVTSVAQPSDDEAGMDATRRCDIRPAQPGYGECKRPYD